MFKRTMDGASSHGQTLRVRSVMRKVILRNNQHNTLIVNNVSTARTKQQKSIEQKSLELASKLGFVSAFMKLRKDDNPMIPPMYGCILALSCAVLCALVSGIR